MTAFAIQRTEIVGQASERGCVRILLADNQDQDRSREWISVQIASDTRAGLQLAAVQLRALQKASELINAEIEALRPLADRSP